MSIIVSSDLIAATKHKALGTHRERAKDSRRDRDVSLDSDALTDPVLSDLMAAAKAVDDQKTVRGIEAILAARAGDFSKPVPNFTAFREVLESYLRDHLLDGWVYVRGPDDKLYPALVTNIHFDDGINYRSTRSHPTVRLTTQAYGHNAEGRHSGGGGDYSVVDHLFAFGPQDVARRRVADILDAQGIYKETLPLRNAYEEQIKRHREVTLNAFARQFRVTGKALYYVEADYRRRGAMLDNRRVVHDMEATDYVKHRASVESILFADAEGVGAIPEHPVVRVFDLKAHEFLWIHGDFLTPYQYDTGLRRKLVLPESHRELLDVLTSDLDAFVGDFIEGKNAGNVILCKGVPGTGKTTTAEVYAELIGRPLYAIHSGNLGTTAEKIEQGLQAAFERTKRWGCVLLLDEADVFVMTRGSDIEQNAIVAEFLRVLEYFDGLLFLTTNRPDDIDEAIIQRCAAIIGYEPPDAAGAAEVWRVMADQFHAKLDADLLAQLVKTFPGIRPRDIKMLLRLALRVGKSRREGLTIELFRRCAMFRAIKMEV